MIRKRYRAWHFVHPDLEANEEFVGLQFSPTGGIEMIDERGSVRQAILLLLSTVPGERVMRPEYGCDLHKLIFSPNDNTTAGLAIHFVRRAIERFEQRVEILLLDAAANEQDRARLDITLEYRLRATNTPDELLFSVNLANE